MIDVKVIKKFCMRTILSFILFFVLHFLLLNDSIYYRVHDFLFASVIDFSYIKSKTSFFIGNFFGTKETFVSSEKLEYTAIEREGNSSKLLTRSHYVVNNLESGVVIHIGDKFEFKDTIIVLGDNGIHYWYSGLENINVHLYDFIESGTILGSTKSDYLTLTLNKEDTYIYYEDMY